MPALVAFGRRWQVGTDDFVFPGILDSTVKSCWLIAAIVVFLQHDSRNLCENSYFMKMYFYVMIAALTVTILTDISIVKKSMSGHIMDKEVRKLVVPLIYVRLFWEFLDVFWNVIATIWAYGETLRCVEEDAPGEIAFIRRFIICNWMSLVCLSLFLAYLFDPLGRDHLAIISESKTDCTLFEPPETRRSLFWERRCKLYCCFCCDEPSPDDDVKRDGFHEVGKLLANLVQDYDLLPSDVLAGLIALYHRSKINSTRQISAQLPTVSLCSKLEKNEGAIVVTSQPKKRKITSFINPLAIDIDSSDEIKMLNYYYKFIDGLNGWKGFLADKHNVSRKTIHSLWRRLICCGCLKRRDGIKIEGDNCCYCSTAVLKESTISQHGINENDLIHISFANDYYQVPFYLAVDHKTKSYILTMRGTFSGKDVITDLTAWPVPTDIPGLPTTFLVHHGILLTARNAKAKIETLGLLEQMQTAYPDYKLVLIGQSLGAAVATLLGMLLRSEFPDLKVYAFSPPGGLLNLEASIWSSSFVTSVIYGDDIVARVSLLSLEKFRSKLIQTLEDCRTPKYKLLMGYCSCCCGASLSSKIEFQTAHEDVKSDICIQVEESKTQDIDHKSPVAITTMYTAGKILHITRRETCEDETEMETEPRYEMRWAGREEFLDIKTSPRMYSDHWPFRMLSAFREYKTNTQPENNAGTDDLNGNVNEAFESC